MASSDPEYSRPAVGNAAPLTNAPSGATSSDPIYTRPVTGNAAPIAAPPETSAPTSGLYGSGTLDRTLQGIHDYSDLLANSRIFNLGQGMQKAWSNYIDPYLKPAIEKATGLKYPTGGVGGQGSPTTISQLVTQQTGAQPAQPVRTGIDEARARLNLMSVPVPGIGSLPMSMVLEAVGGIIGGGELGLGKKLASAAESIPGMGRYYAGLAGGTGEGAALSGVSSAMEGNDPSTIGQDMLMGGLFGFGTALPGGVNRPTVTRPSGQPPASYFENIQDAAARGAQRIKYDTSPLGTQIHNTMDGLLSTESSYNMKQAATNVVNDLHSGRPISADQLNGMKRTINDAKDIPNDKNVAAMLNTHIDNFLQNQPTMSGHFTGTGKIASDALDAAGNKLFTINLFDKMANYPGKAQALADAAEQKNPYFYKNQPGVPEAIHAITQAEKEPFSTMMLRRLTEPFTGHVTGAALGAGLGYELGEHQGDPATTIAAETVGGALVPLFLHGAMTAADREAIQRMVQAGRASAATGTRVDPSAFLRAAPLRTAVRTGTQGILGQNWDYMNSPY